MLKLPCDDALASSCMTCAVVQVPAGEASAAAAAVNKQSQALAQEYGALEKQLDVSVGQSKQHPPNQALTPDSAYSLLSLLLTLPHGVVKYSHTVSGDFLSQKALSTAVRPLHMMQVCCVLSESAIVFNRTLQKLLLEVLCARLPLRHWERRTACIPGRLGKTCLQ